MRKPMLSVVAVSKILLPITGSLRMRASIIGHSTPTPAATSMFSSIAAAMTAASPG